MRVRTVRSETPVALARSTNEVRELSLNAQRSARSVESMFMKRRFHISYINAMLMRSFDCIPVLLTGYRKVILMMNIIYWVFLNENIWI